ncbi:SurA N-terminal domain-containing protein [Saccharopolyspora sp. TS4A08]|uniref:SurA N-terminal domain-containing protein n=1 Tax=Saccharopolyspora ipomoeae TaxID=3042027 RepID=A0ABT6PV55_9PSEU|nr:SurA N-terminal domain-containing protein [Saccharopolyspora sp. TS4A08]MDI2031889.1 SurA N-terminal domain-containing protein [Saccharopolyspora sp. TS4A08]
MTISLRRGRLFASLAVAGVLLSGCGSGPGQAGAAAIVGDQRIPVSEVQSWFSEVLAKEPELKPQLRRQGQYDELGRTLAGQLVRKELVAQAARQDGLTVSEQQVTDMINQWGGPQATRGKIFTPENLHDMARSEALVTELGRRYFDGLAVTFDFTQATTRADAERKAQQMSRGDAAVRDLIAADAGAGVPAAAGQRLRAVDSPKLAASTPLFGAEPGTVLAFEPEPNSGQWLVALIREREAKPSPNPTSAVDDQTLQGVGSFLLGATADRVGVELSPRYGVWDQIGLQAAPNEDETTGFRIDPEDKSS